MIFERITMLQIDYFMAVASHKNFTKAAQSLYVSQPSLSKQVAQLEHEIGVQLFVRSKKGVTFTPAGAVLFEELTSVKQLLKGAFEKARQSGLGANAVINIGCLEAMDTDAFLPKMLEQLKQHHPSVDISLERHSFKILRERLITGALDVIFTLSFEIDDSFAVCSRAVYDTSMSIFMSNTHPLASRDHLTMEDLANEKFVMISRDESPRGSDHFVASCQAHGFSPNIVKQVPNPESLLLSVKSGFGITSMDSVVNLRNPDAFRVFEMPAEKIEIVMAWKEENQLKADLLFGD